MSLQKELRDAQKYADRGNYPTAFGMLERAVAEHLGDDCKCPHCLGVNRRDGQQCDSCEKKLQTMAIFAAMG